MSSRYEELNRDNSRNRARKEHIREWDRDKYSPSFLRERDREVDINKDRQRNKKDIHGREKDQSISKDKKDKKKKGRSKDRESKNEKSQERTKSNERKKKKKKSSKHKKKSKQDSSDNSDNSDASSVCSDDSVKLLQRLEKERLRLNEERKKKKEMLKANETPEEKRARRLREKQAKEHKRRERMGWDGEYQCYTNQDNPFGDSELTQTFVWGKKLTKEGVSVVSREELDAQNRQKQLENKIELEKVKRRRQEREQEREEREAEASAAQRAREAAQMDGWARAEDAFHLQQARLRTQIRIRDGRAKPIDLLASYIGSEDSVDGLEMHEPYTYLNGLQAQDLEDLLEDIEVYKELEKDANLSYWEDMTTIVQDELGKLRRLGAAAQDGGASRRDGIHHAVAQDVTQVFRGKTGAQLEALREQIEAKISGKRDGVDIGYWESLLSQLKAHMARARLRDRHQHNLRRKLQLLKQEQGVDTAAATAQEHTAHALKHESDAKPESTEADVEADDKGSGSGSGSEEEGDEMADEDACTAAYDAGGYGPRIQPTHTADLALPVMTVEERNQNIIAKRAQLHMAAAAKHHAAVMQLEPPSSSSSVAACNESGMEREARRGMGSDEAQFSVEQPLPEQPCLWSDKYRPRKPRYFNRVHTGFEWNKYNQTHYDMDNPPPKIVQGYKFNIFYPDLIDNNNTPSFSLKPCPDNPDFAVLRFIAGPPYEDIAFKIVNREWEYSYKRGFRCHFHNNIFQLWFHFKRYRYRR